jgi:hypothetical protein
LDSKDLPDPAIARQREVEERAAWIAQQRQAARECVEWDEDEDDEEKFIQAAKPKPSKASITDMRKRMLAEQADQQELDELDMSDDDEWASVSQSVGRARGHVMTEQHDDSAEATAQAAPMDWWGGD